MEQPKEASVAALGDYTIPFRNSAKFPKDMRPPHLQDDEVFDSLSIDAMTNQIALWQQTQATKEATALMQKKGEKVGGKNWDWAALNP